ncbi:DUF4231 domain-containing protein [Dactylosporangium sp. NPDC050688]|uniref:DUF4231 domain-containing protein n=1 Tax=Dactylosporangium sp. NPDC050688 TaxID=3157217 RepID=UPI0033E74B63
MAENEGQDRIQPTSAAATGSDFDPADYQQIVDSEIGPIISWYQSHKGSARRRYLGATALTVVAGSAIPIVSLSSTDAARIIVAVLGTLVTILTGLNASYHWDRSWQLFTQAQTALEARLVEFRLTLLAIANQRQRDPAEQKSDALAATQSIIATAHQIRAAETAGFFRLAVRQTARTDSLTQ